MEDLVRGAKVVESARCELLGDSGSAAVSAVPFIPRSWAVRRGGAVSAHGPPFMEPDPGHTGI